MNDRILFYYTLFLFSAILVLFGVTVFFDFYFLTREDGWVEYMSAIFWLACFASGLYLISQRKGGFFFIFLTMFSFVCFGEEVSWGQRIFNAEVPAVILENKVQRELNLHNLRIFMGEPGQRPFRKLLETGDFDFRDFLNAQQLFRILFVFFFFLIPMIRCSDFLRGKIDRIGYFAINRYFTATILFVFLISIFVPNFYFLINGHSNQHIGSDIYHRASEVRECFYALCFHLYVLHATWFHSTNAHRVQKGIN